MRSHIPLMAVAIIAIAGTSSQLFASETNGYQAIVAGNFSGAEQQIVRERRLFPHDSDLLINLALVYQRTGRVAAARQLYQDVLARPDEELDIAGQQSRWSHAIAAEALDRLDSVVASLR